ncbi:MAG: glycosyltransferase family 4 protein, partial [Bacteroidota bacterium]|nr:glycosyltransferase family 4 protein [Bacteroidota bacterium]
DIIHFHWINQGYLSLKSISRILSLKKPVVWTMHDMWTFTGGCHHAGSCTAYKTMCSNCPFLKHPREYDLSTRLWLKKYNIWGKGDITFVACSQWLAGCAKSSGLLRNCRVEAIPNPIETDIFKPLDKSKLKLNVQLKEGQFIILFGAVKVSSYFKGFTFFRDALNLLKQNHPEIIEKIVIGVFGMVSEELLDSLPFKSINFSVVSDKKQMAEIYSLSDVYVTSSLQENLPNTIMESFSCGTPAVAFNVGGIPEMIDHMENGYLAEYMSADDLARGIYWTLFEADRKKLSENARKKAVENYSEAVVAKRYTALYEDILKKH